MKSNFCMTALLGLILGCHAAPASTQPPAAARDAPSNVEEFVRFCEDRTGAVVMYDQEIRVRLHDRAFKCEGSYQHTTDEWMEMLRIVLLVQDLQLVRADAGGASALMIRPFLVSRPRAFAAQGGETAVSAPDHGLWPPLWRR
jgi:hypothetical protein